MKRPTQSDVARLAGVSRATVSYIINGLVDEGRHSIMAETRMRVEKAVKTLGYTPNVLAQGLGSGTSHAIGLLIPDTHNPHYWDITKGVEEVVTRHQFSLLLNSTRLDINRERQGIQMLLQQRVDGLILTPTFVENTNLIIEHVSAQNPPIVVLGTELSGVDSVLLNWQTGSVALIDHLIELGHRNIVFIYGVAEEVPGESRLEVFRQSLQQSGIDVSDDHIVRCTPDIHCAYQKTKQILKRENRPTAILAVNDLLAIGVLRACSEAGLKVPQDISVAGFDDISLGNYLPVALTTVNIESQQIGRHAAEMLFDRLENPDLAQQCRQVDSQLIVRETTGIAKSADN